MAAMFAAQTENWEETQEKMSQLVSPWGRFVCVVCLSLIILFHILFLSIVASPANKKSLCRAEVVDPPAAANLIKALLHIPLLRFRIGHYLLVMFAIVVDRKVLLLG